MAGVVPMSGKPLRKQWFVHDGPRGSLRGLRSQLAEDGCAESQVVLAKRLLEERCELEVDTEENAKLGVYWLTKASEQGNLEATDILRQCLKTGHGITEHNYYDTKCCLEMSQDEKLARRAARELFMSLSNGEDFVTIDQLRRQLRIIRNHIQNSACSRASRSTSRKEENRSLEYGEPFDFHGEKITEAALVSAASNYARGLLPVMTRDLCTVDSNRLALENLPLFHRPLIYPIESLKWLYDIIINFCGRQSTWIKTFLSSKVFTLILLLVYALFGTESLILFVPMASYYFSFIIMVIATFQMLYSKRELNDFRNWSRLFISYSGGNLNSEEAEYQFCKNNLKPYGHFFLALLLNLMIYPVIAQQWTPQSEFTIIAFVLTLFTLFNLACKEPGHVPDFLVLFSFAVHVLAKYPYETDMVVAQTWRFLDIRVPTFASYVVGNGIEFCLNFRAVFYLLIPAVFAKMAARDGWKGTYKTLIPHCVTLSWWQIAILSAQGATWYGLIRGTLGLVGMVLFLPIVSIASVLLPIVAIIKYLSDNDWAMRIVLTAIIGGLPFLISWYLKKTKNFHYNWLITWLQLILGVVAGLFLSWPLLIGFITEDNIISYRNMETLSWEVYQNHCHQPAWEEVSSKAQVQVQCAQLDGLPVSWDGYVTNVRLKSIDNSLKNFLKIFPTSLETKLSCLFGENIENEENLCKNLNKNQQKNCETITKLQKKMKKCHLNNWNKYEFEIYVKMKNGIWGSNAEIILLGDDSFANFSLHIYPGDRIQFNGILSNDKGEKETLLGGMRPHVRLEEVQCLLCHTSDLKAYKRNKKYQFSLNLISQTFIVGMKTVLNFLLNPLVVFK
ncbi:wolframin [Chelonus insularis]|uniref:wolframin n=1 Tax=Chelonus insularis TaxID=460826 RepID=UPI0015891EDF|nr:wolframin [Chelonus insularis]